MLCELSQDFSHRLAQINMHDLATQLCRIDIGQVLGRIAFELFDKDAFASDLAQRLAIRRTGYA